MFRWLFSFTLWLATCQANQQNYNVYHYDRTVPQFTPDGRLLQVEYASAAADHSSPVVAMKIDTDLVLLCTTRTQHSHQERLVLITPQASATSTTDQAPTHATATVVALSGVLADSLSLLSSVQEERWQTQRQLGPHPFGPPQVARKVADTCQQHAFGGGIRPFGAILLVCGPQSGSLVLYQTNPSGAILDWSELPDGFVVVGGVGGSRSLRQRLAAYDPNENTAGKIRDILSLVVEEQQRISPESQLILEAVLVSGEKGILKLTHEQIESLIAKRQNT